MTKESVTRNFTLLPELDEKAVELADSHYNGNISRFLRAAIEDHERALNGKDEFAVRKLAEEIKSLRETVTELSEQVESQPSYVLQGGAAPSQQDESDPASTGDLQVQRQVQRVLLEEGALSLEQLVDCLDNNEFAILDAIETLIQREYVAREAERSPTQYKIKQ